MTKILNVLCLGLDKIEQLQNHANQEVYRKALSIIERYFGATDDTDDNLAPPVDVNEQQFQFAVNSQAANDFEL